MRTDPATHFTARELTWWNGSTLRYTVRDAEGRIQHAYPGDRPITGTVEQVEFKPRPKCLPLGDITRGLECATLTLGLEPHALHFRWQRLPVNSGEAFFKALIRAGANPRRTMQSIGRWREETDARINGYLGKRYRSLTAVAKAITGQHRNGKEFFGLKGGGR